MKLIGKLIGKQKKEVEEILEKAKILNVFFFEDLKEDLKEDSKEIPLDRKENLKLFLESTKTNKEFLGNLFSKLIEINFSGLRKIVIFKKISENAEDWTQGRIDFKNLDIEFRINLQDPRYNSEEPEVQIERIKIIYLLCISFISEYRENALEFKRIIQQSGILEKMTEHFPLRDDSKIEEVKEELLTYLLTNSSEIAALINVPFQQESIEMLKKVVSLKIRSFPTSRGGSQLIALGNLALYFEEANFFQDIKLQKKIKRVINRLNNKMLKGIFDDFRKIYVEIKERRYSREIEKILKEILIPEMPNKYKKILFQKVGQKFQDNQLLKEMEKIQDEQGGDEEIKKIVEKVVKNGVRKEDFEEACNQIWG